MIFTMPTTTDPKNRGINNGSFGSFKKISPLYNVIKEEIQNSLDEARETKNKRVKVTVDFQIYDLQTSMIPCVNEIKAEIVKEIEYWKNKKKNDRSEVLFFERALRILSRENIRCLRISDHNTKGLTRIINPENERSGYESLVLGVGVCDKPSTANGSHGVGKFAAFENSLARIVFYSTRNIEGDAATIGLTMWPSYEYDSQKYTGEGFISVPSNDLIKPSPLMQWMSLQPGYERSRSDFGTDKYIIGFDDIFTQDEFEEQSIISALNSYFVSFNDEKLDVRCGNTLITKDTVPSLIEKYKDKFSRYSAKKTLEYYDTITNPDVVKSFDLRFEPTNKEIKDITFYLKMGSEKCRCCAVTRNSGMKVFDKKNISSIGFSAVCVIESTRANEYFRKLESDDHSDWVMTNADISKKDAEAKIKLLFSHLKNMIKEAASSGNDESSDFEGLNEFLPVSYVLNRDSRKKFEAVTDNIDTIKKNPRKRKMAIKRDIEFEELEQDVKESDTHAKKLGFINKLPPESIRFALKKDGDYQCLRFMCSENITEYCFGLYINGANGKIKVNITKALLDGKAVNFKGNKIIVNRIQKNTSHTIMFKLREEGEWAMEVTTYVR